MASPFATDAFDAVVSNYGVLHFPAHERFFAEAFRVLRRGGRLAFTVWDIPAEAKLFGALFGAIAAQTVRSTWDCPAGPNMFFFADTSAPARRRWRRRASRNAR